MSTLIWSGMNLHFKILLRHLCKFVDLNIPQDRWMQEYRWTRESIYHFDFQKGSRFLVLNFVHRLGLLVSLCYVHSYCKQIEDMSDLLKKRVSLSKKSVLNFLNLSKNSCHEYTHVKVKDFSQLNINWKVWKVG